MSDAHFSSGTLPDDFVGSDDHGPDLIVPSLDNRERRRAMTSIAWGNIARDVTSEHGQSCGYCAVTWPTGVGMAAYTHPGVDISMGRGTPLHAAASGTITFAGWSPRFYRPNQVQITTPDGQLHIYAHMWTVDARLTAGTWVNRGDYLGTSGEQTLQNSMVPDGTGGHLHFEARRASNGVALDPEPILTAADTATTQPQGTTSTTTASSGIGPGACAQVASDGLRLRKSAGTSAPIIREMGAGTALRVLSESQAADGYTWAQVRTRDGETGWAALEYCAPAAAGTCGFLAGDRIRITSTAVRFRQTAGLSAVILRAFALDERACVTGDPTTIDGYIWHPVRSESGEQGWVAGDFCSLVEAGGCIVAGTTAAARTDWPTAAAIDERITLSNRANGRTSKLTGKGARFIELGKRYGINPAIVVAISQRECQLGADGSYLPDQLNNFGGITAGSSGEYPGPCGAKHFGDRYWKVYCSPDEGLEGLFRLLDTPLYRNTGGQFEQVMKLYSPAFENPWDGPGSIWETFRAVGQQLRVAITRDTNVYA